MRNTNLNNSGEAVGTSDLLGDANTHAFLWNRKTGMQDLGTLPGDASSAALAINDNSEIVGVSLDVNFNTRAFIWQDGVMTELNSLIPANSPLSLALACSITARGEITGLAVDKKTGDLHAYLATPSNAAIAEDTVAPASQNSAKPMVADSDAMAARHHGRPAPSGLAGPAMR